MITDGSGMYVWREGEKWFGVKFSEFVKHSVKHDDVATAEAIRDSGCDVVEMYKSPTGVMRGKDD